jgi:hypothetical protein
VGSAELARFLQVRRTLAYEIVWLYGVAHVYSISHTKKRSKKPFPNGVHEFANRVPKARSRVHNGGKVEIISPRRPVQPLGSSVVSIGSVRDIPSRARVSRYQFGGS